MKKENERLTLLPVEQWHGGWAKESRKAIFKMLGFSETLKGYYPLVFPHWNKWRVRFTGASRPASYLTTPGWVAEFMKKQKGAI